MKDYGISWDILGRFWDIFWDIMSKTMVELWSRMICAICAEICLSNKK